MQSFFLVRPAEIKLAFILQAIMSLTLLLYSFLIPWLPCVWDYITIPFFRWASECGPIFFSFPFVLITLCPMRWNLSTYGWHFELSWLLPNTWISACAAKTELLFSPCESYLLEGLFHQHWQHDSESWPDCQVWCYPTHSWHIQALIILNLDYRNSPLAGLPKLSLQPHS